MIIANRKIGLKYPPHRSQSDSSGFFAGTSTTDETIKNNSARISF